MRIDPKVAPAGSAATERARTHEGQAAAPSMKGSAGRVSDSTEVRYDGVRIETLKAELGRLPEIRQDRVDALRRSLLDGSYQIDEQRVAEAVWSDLAVQPKPGE